MRPRHPSSKNIEDNLRASELKFKNIVAASPMGIHQYEIRKEGRLLLTGANPASDRLLGIDHGKLIGKSIEEAFPGMGETEIPARYRDAALDGTLWRTEQVNYDGGLISGAFEVVAFQTEPGQMAVLFNDIMAYTRSATDLTKQLLGLARGGKFEVVPVDLNEVIHFDLEPKC